MAQIPLPTPTDNDVPSTDIRDAVYAGAMLDKVVTSTDLKYTDRLGGEHYTVDGIKAEGDKVVEETRQNLIPLSRQYMTLADAQADIENIPEGSTTYVRSPDGSALADEYANNGGTLEATGRHMPSTVTIDDKISQKLPSGDFKPNFFPLAHDQMKNVPAWFDNSRFDAADLGPVLRAVVQSIPNAWAQYYLRQLDFSPSFFPAWFDQNENVAAWFDKSRFDVAGIGPNLQALITELVGTNKTESFIEGDQYKFNFKRGRIANGVSASLNIAFTGDSWTEKNTIPQSVINILGGAYKDPGWISCSNRTDGVMAGITLVVSNFTKYDGDNENNNAPPQYGSGPDGNAYWNNNTVGTLTWSNVTATDLSLFYYDGSGNFTITIDGGAPVSIAGTNSGVAKKYDITGLSATSHTVVITSSGSGVVSILGMYGKNSAKSSGITVSRMGNGGAMASDYLHWQDWITPIVSGLDIDLLFIILGTNDFRKSAGIPEYTNGIQVIIDKYKSATPGICICLVSPAQCNATGAPALSEYDEAMRKLAGDNNINMVSLYHLFPKIYDNSGGAWADALHLSNLGAYIFARKFKNEFYQE
ncbi:SGNH/GDSL hydrolase family protein [Klebsiella michiganensis]|nr:SGNH/GDSL hydrolase family protein [Klebsiella michiganensis]